MAMLFALTAAVLGGAVQAALEEEVSQWTSGWGVKVQCSPQDYCSTDYPICCAMESTSAFCAVAGRRCCPPTSCDLDEACCPDPDTEQAACCRPGTRCHRGACVPDPCAHRSPEECDAAVGCAFDCDAHRCLTTSSTDPLPSCLPLCRGRGSCRQCVAGNATDGACAWDCTTQSCVAAAPGQSRYTHTKESAMCAVCGPDGTGLVLTADHVVPMVLVALALLVLGVVLVVCCGCVVYRRRRAQRRATAAPDGADDDTPAVRHFFQASDDAATPGPRCCQCPAAALPAPAATVHVPCGHAFCLEHGVGATTGATLLRRSAARRCAKCKAAVTAVVDLTKVH